MNRDDIIRMAREAQHEDFRAGGGHWFSMEAKDLQRFAALAAAAGAAAEREACAKVCEGRVGGALQADGWWNGFREAMRQCAAAIRARKD